MRTLSKIFFLATSLVFTAGYSQAADSITVKEGDTIRLLAAEHLGDSELWPEFLRANELDSVADIRPGLTLKLPAREIVETQLLLKGVREKIQQANRLRARLFAPSEIGNAVALQDRALEERRLRRWDAALKLMKKADASAERALAICEGKRNVEAEAQLVDRQGQVERRRPADVIWSEAELYGMLGEGERVRTLANASAELLFRDDSRLRMDENSQIVIERMRANLLENRQQAKVSLVSGDLFAALGGNRAKDEFDLDLPGIKLDGDSRDFYVRQDNRDTKLANYQGELSVEARGSRVVLEENEGVAVDAVGISGKKSLLPRPDGMLPEDASVIYSEAVTLRWQAVTGADAYWLEVSRDAAFHSLLRSEKALKEAEALLPETEEGTYFWRVLAVDEEGFPGPRSVTRSFQVIHDRQPPYLVLLAPEEGATVSRSPTRLRGIVEQGARLTFRERTQQPDREGDFEIELELEEGSNEVVLTAVDAAGNVSELRRVFEYVPERPLFFKVAESAPRDAAGGLIALGRYYPLKGETLPLSRVVVEDGDRRSLASGRADAQGKVFLNLDLPEAGTCCELRVESPGGKQVAESLNFVVNEELPEVTFDIEPPHYTREARWTLKGKAARTAELILNGTPVALEEGRFAVPLELEEGANPLEFVARDAWGNRIGFRRAIFVDREAPRLIASKLERNPLGPRTQWRIELQAEDHGPLRRAAPFVLTAGGFSFSGLLRLDGDGRHYRGVVETPPQHEGQPVAGVATLSDTLGNGLEVAFD